MNSPHKKWLWGVAVIAIIIVIALVHSSKNPNASSIKVGVILPLSGQYGSLGESVEKAMELSEKSLPSGKVTLLFEDDKYDSKSGLSAYHKLVDVDRADIIIGFGSPTVEIVKPEIAKTDKLMFILGDELSHDTDHVFQTMPQGAGLFDALGTEAGKRFHSVSVVYASDNNLFKNNLDLFKSGLPSTVTVKEFPVQSSSDVRTEVSKIIAAKTDAFTLFVPLETGIKVLKELAKYSTKPQLICDMDIELSIAGYTDAVGSTPFDGCISVAMSDTKTSAFVDQYKKAYSADPQFGSDYGYDVVQIIGQLAEKDKSSWPDYLNSSFNYSGASGSITFDQTGTRPSQGELHIFKDGKFVKIAE